MQNISQLKGSRFISLMLWIVTILIVGAYAIAISRSVDRWAGLEDPGYSANLIQLDHFASTGDLTKVLNFGSVIPGLYTRSYLYLWYLVGFKIFGNTPLLHHLANLFYFCVGIAALSCLAQELFPAKLSRALGGVSYAVWFYCAQDSLVVSLAESVLRVNYLLFFLSFLLFIRTSGWKEILCGLSALVFGLATEMSKEVGIASLGTAAILLLPMDSRSRRISKIWPVLPMVALSIFNASVAISYVTKMNLEATTSVDSANLRLIPRYFSISVNSLLNGLGYYFDSAVNTMGLALFMPFGALAAIGRSWRRRRRECVITSSLFLPFAISLALQCTFNIQAGRFASFIFLPILLLAVGQISQRLDDLSANKPEWSRFDPLWVGACLVYVFVGIFWPSSTISALLGIGSGILLALLALVEGYSNAVKSSRGSIAAVAVICVSFLLPNIARSSTYVIGWVTGYEFHKEFTLASDSLSPGGPILVRKGLFNYIASYLDADRISHYRAIPDSQGVVEGEGWPTHYASAVVQIPNFGDDHLRIAGGDRIQPGEESLPVRISTLEGTGIISREAIMCYPDWALVNAIDLLFPGSRVLSSRSDAGRPRKFLFGVTIEAGWSIYRLE